MHTQCRHVDTVHAKVHIRQVFACFDPVIEDHGPRRKGAMPAATTTTPTAAKTSGEVLARGLYQLSNNCLRERPASECGHAAERMCARREGGGPRDSRTRHRATGRKKCSADPYAGETTSRSTPKTTRPHFLLTPENSRVPAPWRASRPHWLAVGRMSAVLFELQRRGGVSSGAGLVPWKATSSTFGAA